MLSIGFKPHLAITAAILFAMTTTAPATGVRAADLEPSAAPLDVSYGVDCAGPEAQSFGSVWLGHFTGGYSQYSGAGGTILLDWRDEKLCFPSRRSCDRWIAGLRRDYHRPEGYFTCLTIR